MRYHSFKKLVSLLADPFPGIEDRLLSSLFRWKDCAGRPEFYTYCSGTSLEYLGSYSKWRPAPHEMFCDDSFKERVPDLKYAPADLGLPAFYKGLAKFGKAPFEVPEEFLEIYKSAVMMMRLHFNFLRGCHKWSKDQVLANMRRDTSPGPALKTMYSSKGEAVDDLRFWNWLEIFKQEMSVLGGSITYWGASSKEELRTLDRVAEEKTRVFMSGSLFHYFLSAQLCSEFNERFYSSFMETSSAVGMSKFNGGFHFVWEDLKWKGNCGMDDASGWDTCMFPRLVYDIAQFRYDCLSDVVYPDNIIFINLYQQDVESFMLTPSGEVITKKQGGSSGKSNTIVDNTLGHFIVNAYSWLRSMYKIDTVSSLCVQTYLREFERNVIIKLFGDDNIYSISDLVKSQYTIEKRLQFAKELGFIFTSLFSELTDKDGLEFLSHRVLISKGFYVPYLSLDRLCAAAVYSISSSVLIRAQRLSNLRYEGYYTPGWLPIIDSLIALMKERFPETTSVFSSAMSDAEIEHLYLPLESGHDKRAPRILNTNWINFNDQSED